MNSIKHPSAGGIARAFVSARAKGQAIADFPGAIPADLDEAYAIQDAAIDLWQDDIGGWKVGRIGEPLATEFGVDRLAGPIFKRHIWCAGADTTDFPIFAGGFGAVEAEFILEVADDTPADKTVWTRDEAKAVISAVYTGVEIASSPLATINQHGPRVIVSDFGNNASLIVGPELDGWQTRPFDDWRVETFIEDDSIATGTAAGLPGGPFESVRFLLELSAKRGMPLRRGCLISSGAISGVHDILPGQRSRISFGKDGDIFCAAVKGGAEPEAYPDAFTA
ncbi:2-keto-4-pentenoate hydratase [Kordiimonas sp.]|uniref:2-keto-4-pentenoate hydratase n=1 Tax=Kordiimonas sp. TaxID=1970157 RepID=UPI003A9504E3